MRLQTVQILPSCQQFGGTFTEEGVVEGRFVGFSDVSIDRSAAALAEHISAAVAEMVCGSKLDDRTYDGAAVLSDELSDLQAKVRERYPCPGLVHFCAHVLNLVLSQNCKVYSFQI